jgi:hypothetical protein
MREFMKNLSDNLSPNFIFLSGDPNLRHSTTKHGLFLPIFIIFLQLGFYFLYQKNKKILILLLGWWLLALIPASVPETTPHALRSINALMPLGIIIGLGLGYLILKLTSVKNLVSNALMALLLAVIFVSLAEFSYYYFKIYPNQSALFWQSPYKQLANEIIQNKNKVDIVYASAIDSRFHLWLMAYGPYSGQDFQSWQSIDFGYPQIENIYLDSNYYPQKVENKVMLITPLSARPILGSDKKIISEKVISDPLGQKKYLVLIIKQI